MKRVQLYLDEQLWKSLRVQARNTGTTVSELVRETLRERYWGDLQKRKQAMQALIGRRKNRDDFDDAETDVRDLRRGSRLDRLNQK
jgi:hypothetical protein